MSVDETAIAAQQVRGDGEQPRRDGRRISPEEDHAECS